MKILLFGYKGLVHVAEITVNIIHEDLWIHWKLHSVTRVLLYFCSTNIIEIYCFNQFFENESNENIPRIVLYIQHLIQTKPIFDQVSLEN